jgi:hypothetical protein
VKAGKRLIFYAYNLSWHSRTGTHSCKVETEYAFLKNEKKKKREEKRKVDTFWTGLLSNSTELLEEPINHSDLDTWRYCNLTVKE